MNRSLVTLRDADLPDAEFLAELWARNLRRAEHHEQVGDLEQVIKTASVSPEQRLVIAEYDGQLAGAVLLRIAPLTPLNPELAVLVVGLRVAQGCRRHGVGRMLMEAAVAFAEDAGAPQVATGVEHGGREANRFMARLALAATATYRVAPTTAVRSRLTARHPTIATTGSGKQLTRVLAARRSMRRHEPSESVPPPTA